MRNHGAFAKENPKTEWLVDPSGEDRDMALLEEFWYEDPDGRKWTAPKGKVVNGASIPSFLWTSVGSPYTDNYRRASIVHDVACDDKTVDRKEADVMFYYACLAGGCGGFQAWKLYLGVRVGAWSSKTLAAEPPTEGRMLHGVAGEGSWSEQTMEAKFEEMSTELLQLPDDASIADLDAIIQKHLDF